MPRKPADLPPEEYVARFKVTPLERQAKKENKM
jgi:hypothetical protein